MFSKVCFKYLYLWEFNTFRDGKKQVAVRNDKVLCLSVPGQKSFEQKLLFINTEFKIYFLEKICFYIMMYDFNEQNKRWVHLCFIIPKFNVPTSIIISSYFFLLFM